jgi:crossover junction endodeoxyribonuclease RuvC
MKKYIGIDPGTNIMGYAVIEVDKKNINIVTLGVLKMGHIPEHQHKLKRIFEKIQSLIKAYNPEEMAIEAPFFGKNVQSMLKLGRAQGVAMAAAITSGVEITEYSPKQIKLSVTGSGNASKEQVSAMLQSIIGYDFTVEYLDATDALGAAVCHHFKSGNKLKGKKQYKDWSSYLSDNPKKVK